MKYQLRSGVFRNLNSSFRKKIPDLLPGETEKWKLEEGRRKGECCFSFLLLSHHLPIPEQQPWPHQVPFSIIPLSLFHSTKCLHTAGGKKTQTASLVTTVGGAKGIKEEIKKKKKSALKYSHATVLSTSSLRQDWQEEDFGTVRCGSWRNRLKRQASVGESQFSRQELSWNETRTKVTKIQYAMCKMMQNWSTMVEQCRRIAPIAQSKSRVKKKGFTTADLTRASPKVLLILNFYFQHH